MTPAPPPTVLVMHPTEKRRKCTVTPLRGHPGLVFVRFQPEWAAANAATVPHGPLAVVKAAGTECVRLGLNGPPLDERDAHRGLLLLDGTWRRAAQMERCFDSLPVRSLDPRWRTAYPRRSKVRDDPEAGLATVEALFAAWHTLGRNTEGLLAHYYWADEFLRLNAALIDKRLGSRAGPLPAGSEGDRSDPCRRLLAVPERIGEA